MISMRYDILDQTIGLCTARKIRNDDKSAGRDKGTIHFAEKDSAPRVGEKMLESFDGESVRTIITGNEMLIEFQQAEDIAFGGALYA